MFADGLSPVFAAKVGVKTGTSGAGPTEILGRRGLLAQDGHKTLGCQWVPTKTLVQSGGCLDVKYILYMMVPPQL